MIKTLDTLIEIWKVSLEHHYFNPGASELELDFAEKKLGHQLPSVLRNLYSFSNGFELLHGNVQIYPLEEHEYSLGLTTASEKLHGWGWPIASEILIIGGNGSDDLYGIWIPNCDNPKYDHPIIQIGEIFEPGCMTIVGTGLIPFLINRTAFFLQVIEAGVIPLDKMGLPMELRKDDLDESLFAEIIQWADPNLPDSCPDPYKQKLTVEDLKKLFTL